MKPDPDTGKTMTTENFVESLMAKGENNLSSKPPVLWPDPRCHGENARYEVHPPFKNILKTSDLVAGVLVGVTEKTVHCFHEIFSQGGSRRVLLVVVVFPAGPTRESHLSDLKDLVERSATKDQELQVRVLPVTRAFGPDFERMVLPPTVLQAHNSESGETHLCIGSVGDIGNDAGNLSSFNVVFKPDDALRDKFRRWFQFILSNSAPLTIDTIRIPHLSPPSGDSIAAEMWADFEDICSGRSPEVKVDPETGEVTTEADGSDVKPWDENKTALDPLAQKLQEAYSSGCLATIDETTRIKPLAIPVKATLLGQQSERTLGLLTQKQSFNLKVLDEAVGKEVEKYRVVNDILGLLSYQLSKGSHWMPDAAQLLCDKELEVRNTIGLACLKSALGGDEVPQFVEKRKQAIRKDLDAMYVQLGQGTSVPEDRLPAVFNEIENRLTTALTARITPRLVYNKIAPTTLTVVAPDESWSQPFSLLLRAARVMRESITDPYFPRRFKGLGFSITEFRDAMDIFCDSILRNPDSRRALDELSKLSEIENGESGLKEKCKAVWDLISAK